MESAAIDGEIVDGPITFAELRNPDVCFEGEVFEEPEVFEELWIATEGQGDQGPAGFASAEFRKLSKADLYTIREMLKREARINTDGMWLGTWLQGRHWKHEPLTRFSGRARPSNGEGEGFAGWAFRKAKERAARELGGHPGPHPGEGFSARAVRKARERAARMMAAETTTDGMRTEGFFSRGRGETFAERAAKEREREARMQARRRRDIDEWKMRIAAGGYKSGRNWCDDPSIYAEAQRELEAEKANA